MDEFLSAVICWHYFGKKRGFPELWKTKRFKSFNYFILEKLYLLQKLDLVRSIHDTPKWVSSDLAALNELRNGIAHSFFFRRTDVENPNGKVRVSSLVKVVIVSLRTCRS